MSVSASEPVRVLQIVGNAIVGGMENYVERLVRKLPAERFSVTCLCPYESPFTLKLRTLGFKVHVAPIPDEPGWKSIQYGAALIEAEGIEVIHSHLANAHLLAGMLSRMTNTPALATIHGRDVLMPDLEIQRLADTHLCVVSPAGYYQALNAGVPRNRLSCVPNAVDADVFRPQPEPYLQQHLGLPDNTPLVGFVGRFSPEKGPEVFVRAAAIARHQLPEVRFVMVGEGPMLPRVRELAQTHGVADRLYLAGLHEDMPRVFNSLELLVSTSHSEGMPLAVMEAQACGLPVVATHVGGVPDIVVLDVTGRLVVAGKPDDTANAIVALMQNEARRKAMGEAARARMESHFRLDERVAEIDALLTRLARGAVPAQPIPALASVKAVKDKRRAGLGARA